MATAPKAPALEESQPRFYIRELDSLRFFAFLTVLVFHQCTWHKHMTLFSLLGWFGFGVDLFFTLSAYLIAELLLREEERFGSVNLKAFYARRILRIWPLYFCFLAVLFSVHSLIGINARYFGYCSLFVSNLPFRGWDPGSPPALCISPLWSISLEEQFYLCWPLLMSIVPKRHMRSFVLLLWGLSIMVRALIPGTQNLRIDGFACGILIACSGRALSPRSLQHRVLLFVSAMLCWFLAGMWLFGPYARTGIVLAWILSALGSGGLLLSAIGSTTWLRDARLVYLGRISYGLYVFHGSAIVATAALGILNFWWSLVVAFILTVCAGAASYRWLESPFLKLKKRFELLASRPEPH